MMILYSCLMIALTTAGGDGRSCDEFLIQEGYYTVPQAREWCEGSRSGFQYPRAKAWFDFYREKAEYNRWDAAYYAINYHKTNEDYAKQWFGFLRKTYSKHEAAKYCVKYNDVSPELAMKWEALFANRLFVSPVLSVEKAIEHRETPIENAQEMYTYFYTKLSKSDSVKWAMKYRSVSAIKAKAMKDFFSKRGFTSVESVIRGAQFSHANVSKARSWYVFLNGKIQSGSNPNKRAALWAAKYHDGDLENAKELYEFFHGLDFPKEKAAKLATILNPVFKKWFKMWFDYVRDEWNYSHSEAREEMLKLFFYDLEQFKNEFDGAYEVTHIYNEAWKRALERTKKWSEYETLYHETLICDQLEKELEQTPSL